MLQKSGIGYTCYRSGNDKPVESQAAEEGQKCTSDEAAESKDAIPEAPLPGSKPSQPLDTGGVNHVEVGAKLPGPYQASGTHAASAIDHDAAEPSDEGDGDADNLEHAKAEGGIILSVTGEVEASTAKGVEIAAGHGFEDEEEADGIVALPTESQLSGTAKVTLSASGILRPAGGDDKESDGCDETELGKSLDGSTNLGQRQGLGLAEHIATTKHDAFAYSGRVAPRAASARMITPGAPNYHGELPHTDAARRGPYSGEVSAQLPAARAMSLISSPTTERQGALLPLEQTIYGLDDRDLRARQTMGPGTIT